MQIDDETLMAFADGELDPDQSAKVQAAIDADPALQVRLRAFTETRAALKSAIAPQSSLQDTDLIARIRAASVAPPRASAQPEPAPRLPKPANFNLRPFATAIAAAMALAVVGGIWWQSGGPDQGGMAAAQVAALNELPSGEARETDGGTMTVIASYRAGDGALCREYETADGHATRVAVACREGEDWAERFAVDLTADGGYQPASGDIPGLDDFLTSTGAGQPMTADEEAAALAE